MSAEKRFWQLLGVLVVLSTAAVPVYSAYDLHAKGPIPEKRVELHKFHTIDPMEDLSALGDKVTLSLQIENQETDNLLIAKAWLRNVGAAPVLPEDYYQNISVNVHKPWKILAVENAKEFSRNVEFKWKRISDIKFEAEPALLNPGDMVATNIYITNTESRESSVPDKPAEADIEWKARIVKLRDFTKAPDWFDATSRSLWIRIDLEGWAVPFTILTAMLFLALHLHLLFRAGFIRTMQLPAILLVLGAGLLSFAAAESMATYYFGNVVTKILGVQHWMNAPWIILNAAVLIFLWRKARPSSS